MSELLERLAELEHEQWSHWIKYMFSNWSKPNAFRWIEQSKKSYEELTEEEKESDREWAKKALAIFSELTNNGDVPNKRRT